MHDITDEEARKGEDTQVSGRTYQHYFFATEITLRRLDHQYFSIARVLV